MKKRWICLILALCVVFLCAGCDSAETYTYTVGDDDVIILTVDTSGGYDFSSEIPFAVTKGGQEQSTGQFLYIEDGEDFINSAQESPYTTIVESGEKDGNQYVFWNYNDTEYNYVVLIHNSDTAVVLGNRISEESARECFARLSFSVQH